jgi:tellurite resistance protein TehA-like permease
LVLFPGSTSDYEYNLYFDRAKNRTSKKEVAGLSLILFGIGATALSYLTAVMSAAPGQKYFVFFGMMIAVGAYMLIFSDRD